MNNPNEKIRLKIILPVIIMIIGTAVLSIYGGYIVKKAHVSQEIKKKTEEVGKLFGQLLESESKFMEGQLKFIADNPVLLEAWESRNREELYEVSRAIFDSLKSALDITHFYFIEPDKTCFLRVHSPERFGDRISRKTLQKTEESSKVSSGKELGPMGTFTLRVVSPWVIKGKLVGYLELGKEVDHLTPEIKMISGVDIVRTIDKSFLDYEQWKKGMQIFGGNISGDLFEDFIIIDQTIDQLPDKFLNVIEENHLAEITKEISYNQRHYSVCAHPLRDFSGKQLGSTVVIFDITEILTSTKQNIIKLVLVILAYCLLIVSFFYRYSGKIEKEILKHRNNLEGLVKERTKELHLALDDVKVLSGMLPICSSCKQIRDDEGYWTQIESYIDEHSEAQFTHGICPECIEKIYPDLDKETPEK